MSRFALALLLPMSLTLAGIAHAQPLDWIERYALATDRAAVLSELIPGSEDHYFYHCLHYQVSGQLDKAEALLTQWKADERTRYSGYVQGIEDRQRLLTYKTSPDRTVEYLRNRLGIDLYHAAPAAVGQQLYPATFDTSQLDLKQLIDAVQMQDLTHRGLRVLAARVLGGEVTLDPDRFAGLLNRVDGPWLNDLDKLVIQELQTKRPDQRRFGDRTAHQWLTLDQLREVAKAVPAMAASDQMVAQVLIRLRPSDDEDMRQQPAVRDAYLERLEQYVSTLPDAYISLKAATLYQRLQHDLSLGKFDRERFLRYLQTPRSSNLVPDRPQQARRAMAELGQDFSGLAVVPAIGDEQPLVRTYLEHFLQNVDSTKEFDGLLKPDYLNAVFAETKLLGGVEPSDRWYEMLDPARRQQIRDRVELTLAPTNSRSHDANTTSSLVIDLKRVEKLVVRIYRINTHSYYRTRTTPIDTDVDLDGLIPTFEREIAYTLVPSRRHRETIELPEVKDRGVWIVDLLGGGLRARAMIRRGEVQYAISQSANGMRVTAMNEHRQPIAGAKLVIASQELTANEDGQIEIPPLGQAVQRNAVLQDQDLAVPVSFPHLAESYSLQVAWYVDQQQLQTGKPADLIVRPRLLMAGKPIDPATLQDAVVTVTATDLDGISTTKRYENLKVTQTEELSLSLRVPPRLASLSAVLSGKVRGLAKNDLQELNASHNWDVATVRRTTLTTAAHLTRSNENWVIETRGRGGEVIGGTVVQVTMHPSVRSSAVYATLQSNPAGLIDLGPLPVIDSIDITCGGNSFSQNIRGIDAIWPARLHSVAGIDLQLPLPSNDAQVSRFRLLSLRGGDRPTVNLASSLQAAGGMLTIKQIAAGNYQLHDLELGRQTQLFVTAGPILGDVAVGVVRQLQLAPRSELGIASIDRSADGMKINVTGATSATRVHLLVNRYVDRANLIDDLRLPDLPTSLRSVWHGTNGYISDLRLGEEYQYVMRRQYAAKYPGVMLPQPGLILNPWETRSTDNESEVAQVGDMPMPAAAAPAPMSEMGRNRMERESVGNALSPDFDFLQDSGAVVTNLIPDKDGLVTVPQDVIAGMPIIQVVVADPIAVVRRTVYGPRGDADLAEMRLAKALDAKRALAFARGVVLASANKPLDLKSLGSAQLQVYSSIADLMRLFLTMQTDERLKEFQPIANWHTLEDNGKRSLYGRLACHELHLFLSVHDPAFFEKVIRPYLQNKPEKQLVDHYLLGDDLTPWTEMWRYQQLNAAEKVLLARRIPAMAETVRREFRELVELRPDDQAAVRKLIEFGLAGSALSDELALNGSLHMDSLRDLSAGFAFSEMDGAAMDGSGSGGALGAAPAEPLMRSKQMESRRGGVREMAKAKDRADASDKQAWMFEQRGLGRSSGFFQNLDSTKQWAESQWDRVRVTNFGSVSPRGDSSGLIQSPSLVPVDPFWLALANADSDVALLNEHLLRPISSRHSVLVALAFCGLPLDAGDVKLPVDDKPFAPNHPVALVTKRLIDLAAMEGEASLLVGQRFSGEGDDYSNPKAEVPVAPSEFVVTRVYRGEVILTNPTPKQRTVDVLWQIPAGSLPLAGGQATDSKTLTLDAFAVQRIEYSFYFPKAGDFSHYPVCVGVDGKVVARGTERTFNVVTVPSQLDEESWPAIAGGGDAAKIDGFLAKANLRKIDLGLVAPRMKDRAIYDVVTKRLAANQIDRPDLWGYAVHHRDLAGMKTYLSQQASLVAAVGPAFRSELLNVNPVDRRTYEFLEYSPLVLGRIHPLKAERDILNPTFKEQYLNLIRVLAYQSQSDVMQQLSLVYYMILQNRIETAIAMFSKIDGNQVETKLQYDYVAGYLALHRGDYATALKLASANENHPVPRWRERFAAMSSNLRQRDQLMQGDGLVNSGSGKPGGVPSGDADLSLIDRDQRNADSATMEAFVKVDVDGAALKIEHRNAASVVVNLYAVDLELLFSKTPFVREDLATMAMVEPTQSERIELDAKDGVKQIRLDDKLARQTLLVEVVSGAARSTTLYYGGKLSAYVSQGFGQLQVSDSATRQPVEGAYVKVYARHQDGTVSFYKDGYTDLRGRYDYVSLSTGDLATAQRFAILVIDHERGATLQEAAPPTK